MTGRSLPRPLWGLALLIAVAGFAHPTLADVTLRDAWVAETPPAAMSTAAFGVLRNGGEQGVVLVKLSSPACEVVEMHRTTLVDGIARMEQIERLELAPGAEIRFEPGGAHWMLMRPRPLASGDEVAITLEFADGTAAIVHLPVKARDERPAGHPEHSHH